MISAANLVQPVFAGETMTRSFSVGGSGSSNNGGSGSSSIGSGMFSALKGVASKAKRKKGSVGASASGFFGPDGPAVPVVVSVEPPDGDDAPVVDGYAGDGAIMIQGRVRISHSYLHPVPITIRNLEIIFRGELTIRSGTDKRSVKTVPIIEEKMLICNPLTDAPIRVGPPSATSSTILTSPPTLSHHRSGHASSSSITSVASSSSLSSLFGSSVSAGPTSSTASSSVPSTTVISFFMPLPETETIKLPATTTFVLRSQQAYIKYSVSAKVWGIDVDDRAILESRPMTVVLERSNPKLLNLLGLYPERIHEISGQNNETTYTIKVPKMLVPLGRLEFTYHFQSTSPPSISNLIGNLPRRLEITLIEEVKVAFRDDDVQILKKKMRPAVLENDRLLMKGWNEPAKIVIKLPSWTGLKEPDHLASLMKTFRADDPLHKHLDTVNGSLLPESPAGADAAGKMVEGHLKVMHSLELQLIFANGSRALHSVPIIVLPAKKPGSLAATFELLMRSYGGVGATYADRPPPNEPPSPIDFEPPLEYEMLEYERILNGSPQRRRSSMSEITSEMAADGASAPDSPTDQDGNSIGFPLDDPPPFDGLSPSAPSTITSPARIACVDLSPSYTLQTLAVTLTHRPARTRSAPGGLIRPTPGPWEQTPEGWKPVPINTRSTLQEVSETGAGSADGGSSDFSTTPTSSSPLANLYFPPFNEPGAGTGTANQNGQGTSGTTS